MVTLFTITFAMAICSKSVSAEEVDMEVATKSAMITSEGMKQLYSERTKVMPQIGEIHLFGNLTPMTVPIIKEWDIYNVAVSEPAFYIQVWDPNSYAQYTAYCLDYGLNASSNMNMPATNLNQIGGAQGRLLRAALSFGYSDMVVQASLTDSHRAKYAATQAVIWSIQAGIYGTDAMNQASNRFFSYLNEPEVALNAYYELIGKINQFQVIPSFSSDNSESAAEYELKWNKKNHRFEITLTDTNNILHLCDFPNNFGIEIAEKEDNKMTLFTTQLLENQKQLKGTRSEMTIRDAAVFYWNRNTNYQRIACLDLDGGSEAMPFYLNVRTNAASIELQKVDSENVKPVPQGKATLNGAVYDIYDDGYIEGDMTAIKESYVCSLTLGESAKAETAKLPIMNYYVKERNAPMGYNLDEKTYQITFPHDEKNIPCNATLILQEEVIRGDVQIMKFGQDGEGTEAEIKKPLEGVIFTFTSQTTGEKIQIMTDKYGMATTKDEKYPRGRLCYDTYTVTESNTPEGYQSALPFEITIEKEKEILSYAIENKTISRPLCVIKIDASTGKPVPIPNTQFHILDKNKKVISMTTYYPKKEIHKVFKTDEMGQFVLPNKLNSGTYFLEEIKAPQGYLLGVPLEFEITEGADWDQPFVICYANENAMGKVEVHKSDAVSKAAISEVIFDIIAAETIYTPDGTIRVEKGMVVDSITTDEQGIGISKNLYLGNYIIRETKAAEGYLISTTEYPVVLEYKDQYTKIVTRVLDVTNLPITLSEKPIEVLEKPVKTGDTNNIHGWMALALISGLLIWRVAYNRIKYQ